MTPQPADSQVLLFRNGAFRVTADGVQPVPAEQAAGMKAFPCRFRRLAPSFTGHWERGAKRLIDIKDTTPNMLKLAVNSSRLHWREEFISMATGILEKDQQYYEEHRFDTMGPRLNETERTEQEECLAAKLYAIGFLLHASRDPKLKAGVWFHDAPNKDGSEPCGVSGKSMTVRFVGRFRNTAEINGRNESPDRNPFFWDSVGPDTELVHIDDLARHQASHAFSQAVAKGITVQRKYRPDTEMQYAESPKIVVSSPWAPEETRCRGWHVWLTATFSDWYRQYDQDGKPDPYTPVQDFGCVAMDEKYPEELWNAEANFAVDCLVYYFEGRRNRLYTTEKGGLV